MDEHKKKTRGRGQDDVDMGRYSDQRVFDRLGDKSDTVGFEPQKSVEGYVIIVSNLHEEASEEDVYDAFAEHGEIDNIHLNLDRRTGFVKGYCFLEYRNFNEAKLAISRMDGSVLQGNHISVSWAFMRGPNNTGRTNQQRK